MAFGVAVWLCVRLTAAHAVAALAAQTGVFGDEADVAVERPGGRLAPSVLAAVRAADGVATAYPELAGPVLLDAVPGAPDALRVLHVEAFDLLAPLPRAFEFRSQLPGPFAPAGSGPDPSLLIDRRGVVVSSALATARALRPGDSLDVRIGAVESPLRVAAVFPHGTTAIDDDVAVVDIATAQALFGTTEFDRIACTAEPGEIERMRAPIAAVVPHDARIVTTSERRSEVEHMLAGFVGNAIALADLALLVAMLLTYDAIAISVVRRRGQIGTLRALGATRSSIASAFVAEGVLLGAVGALVGVTAGTLVARVAGAVAPGIDPYAYDRSAPIESFAVGILIATFAAILPARAAAALRPALAWSERPFGSARVSAVGEARLRAMPAVALGLALLASVPRRVAMSVASLAAAVALAVAVLTFASSFRTSLDVWSANVLTGDLTIRPLEGSDAASASRFTSALLDRIRSVAGVAGVSGSRTIAFPLHGALVDVASDGVTGGRVASGDATFDDAAPGAVVDSAFAARAGLRIGDVFALPNVPAIRVVRIDPGDPLGEGRIALHRATFVRVTDDTTFDTIVVRTRPGADFGRLRARLARALAPRVLDIVTTHDLRARTIRRFDAAARETFAVAAVALAVGAAGIGVTLSALVLEFRDDLRLLRHVGLTRRATRSLVFAQAACVGSVGALLGSVCGIAIAFVSLLVDAARFGSPLRLDVPFGEIVAIVIASVLLAIVASAGPARVAARLALGGASRAVLGIVLIVASGHPLGATTVRRAPAVVPTGTERTVWRVLGHLHARDGSRYDVATTFFRYELDDVSDMKQRAPWQSRAFFSSATSIVDEDAHATTTGTRTDRGGIGFAHGDPATFDVGVDDWSLRPAPPGPRAAWRLRVATDLARVDLTLVAMRPVVALGTNGVVRTGSCRRCLASALALPRVDATGTLAYGTRRITVTGTFWIDRESGGPQLAPADRGWERFTVQFDDGRALVVRFVRDQRHRVVTSDGTFVGANGRIVNLEANDLVLEHPLGTVWRNDRGIEYPSLWDLYVRRLHLDLALVPDVQAQEIAVGARGAHFYLGSLDVERAHPGPRDPGRGFAESTGYEGSLTF